MAQGTALPLPEEVPWRLASTTQPLAAGEPDQTSMSLFIFEPDEEDLVGDIPGDRLVFLKVTASVSPASFPTRASRTAAAFLGEGIPCFHLLLDLKVREAGEDAGTIRPYFHAAAPLNRRMIETGVVGSEAFEGDSEAHLIGKSGSQMYESLKSHSNTLSVGASGGFSIGPFSAGGSVRNTATDLSSDRAVSQVVDTTTRQASEERRELLSHTTKVENVLTLLNAKYVGTPHLSFSLAPQPLRMLSIDPSDPNLWFQQLLARRSSGIEGIQEFTAVVVVPEGQDFCVNARLRRVCLLDSPPGPLTFDEQFDGNLLQLARQVEYLYRTFPRGTPLEELDVDLIGSLPDAGRFKRPVVELWAFRLLPQIVEAMVVSPSPDAGVEQRGSVNYKHLLELWLDTLRDEYERELARSPLERGVLLGENRFLDTCFESNQDGALEVGETSAAVGPLFRVPIRPGTFDVGGVVSAAADSGSSVRTRALETVARWNAMDRQLTTLLANRQSLPETPLSLKDARLLQVLVDRWAKLSPDDELNFDLERAASLLDLDARQRKLLAEAGAKDLRGIARALQAAPEIDQRNTEIHRLRNIFKKRRLGGAPPDPIEFSVSPKSGREILDAIGAGLETNASRDLAED